jgi:sulfur carrier protein ThiS
VTVRVQNGTYSGSGKILLNAFKKYPKAEWATEILSRHLLEQDAYDREEQLVTAELLANPRCLNISLGGKGGSRRQHSAEEKQKRNASIRATKSTVEHRELMSRVATIALGTDEAKQKLSIASIAMWHNPETAAKINDARSAACGDMWKANLAVAFTGKPRRSFKVEVNGEVYPSRRSAMRALNLNRKQICRHPTYREIY